MPYKARLFIEGSKKKNERPVASKQQFSFARAATSPVNQVLSLQRTIGNQAVQRLLATSTIQPKLSIGQPDDVYEQEADRVAEQVMRMPEPCLQRQEEEEEQEGEILQAKEVPHRTPTGAADLESRIHALHGGGRPLPVSVRAFFEPRLGLDLSSIRVHMDTAADALNQSLSARAFTVGRDIFFRQGEGDAGGSSSQHLLAHELVHVVQQTGGTYTQEGGALQDKNSFAEGVDARRNQSSYGTISSTAISQAPTSVQRDCPLLFEGTAYNHWSLFVVGTHPVLVEAIRRLEWREVHRISRQMATDAREVRFCIEANRSRLRSDRYRVLLNLIDGVLRSLRTIITHSRNLAAGSGGSRTSTEVANAHLSTSIPYVLNFLPEDL